MLRMRSGLESVLVVFIVSVSIKAGGPRGRVVRSADISLPHLTIRSHVATCGTSQVLLAGVSGGFSRGSPVFAPPTDWLVSYELK